MNEIKKVRLALARIVHLADASPEAAKTFVKELRKLGLDVK